MPRPRKSKKRSYRRRRTLAIQTQPMINKSQKVILDYVDQMSIDAGTGVVGAYRFRANGMYDPRFETGGHQPRGYDQWMAFYDHYTVIGSRITVTAFSNSNASTSAAAGYIGIMISDSSIAVAGETIDYVMEQGKSVWKPYTENDGARGVVTCSRTFSAKKFFGCTNVLDREDLKGSTTSDPNEQATFHVWQAPVTGAANPTEVYFTVKIRYIAVLTEPKQLSQS